MRALFRLGWREARRHRLRSTLVTALIGLPVAVGVVGVLIGPWYLGLSGPEASDADGADLVIDTSFAGELTPGAVPLEQRVETALAAVRQVAPDARTSVQQVVTAWRPESDGADAAPADSRTRSPVVPVVLVQQQSDEWSGTPRLRSGRAAVADDEVVLDERTAEQAGLSVGDRLELALPRVELRVVGIAAAAGDCEQCRSGAVTAAAFDDALAGSWSRDGRSARVLVEAPPGVSASELQQRLTRTAPTLFVTIAAADEQAVRWARLGSTVGVAFLLVWTGLIAATGLAVGARRRQRELGLLAANGADPAQLRLAVVAEGALVGLVGSVAGAALALGGLAAVTARWPDSDLAEQAAASGALGAAPWVLLVMACGVVAAVLAARAAAAGLARLTPHDLLRGRRPSPRPAPHWFAVGALALVVGFVVADLVSRNSFTGGSTYEDTRLTALMVVLSLASVTVGLVATVVGASRLLPRLTSWAGVPVRLAGRDLARNGLRVGASCGAVALTLAAAIAMATLAEDARDTPRSEQVDQPEIAELSRDQRYLEVWTDGFDLVGDQVVDRTPGVAIADRLRSAGIDVVTSQAYFLPAGLEFCSVQAGQSSGCEGGFVLVLDDTSALRPELRAALDAGTPATARGPVWQLRRAGEAIETIDPIDREDTSAGAGPGWQTTMFDQNSLLVATAGAEALGVDRSEPSLASRVLVVADTDDLGVAERARRALVGTGSDVVDSYPPDRWQVWWFVAAGIAFVTIVTLLVVLFALALMRIESRGDDGVLAVSGASPSVLRRTQAARAAVMVLMAAVPACAVGWGLLRVFTTTGEVDPSGPAGAGALAVPWWAIGVVVVGLPLLAGLLAGATDRPARRLRLG